MLITWLILSGAILNIGLIGISLVLGWEFIACMIRSASKIRFYFAVAAEHGWKGQRPTVLAVIKEFFKGIAPSWKNRVYEITGEGGVWRGVGNWQVHPRKVTDWKEEGQP